MSPAVVSSEIVPEDMFQGFFIHLEGGEAPTEYPGTRFLEPDWELDCSLYGLRLEGLHECLVDRSSTSQN